jgi:uncharacterized protein (TIGR02271 family)
MNRYEDKETGVGRSTTTTAEGRGSLTRYIDYDVVDKADHKIGTLNCLWSEQGTGEPAFLGIKTGWFSGKAHVVPAHSAVVNEKARKIRLPFSEDMIKGAPAYDADLTLDQAKESEIYDYYHIRRPEGLKRMEAPEGLKSRLDETRMEERRETPRFATGLEHEPSAPKPEGTEETRIELSEEELKIGKRQVEAGGVRLHKIIRTETVNQPVSLEREEVVIERVPSSELHSARGEAFSEQDVFIPLRREEAVVSKESHVREEVRAHKRTVVEQQQVSGSIRKEDVQVEKQGEDIQRKNK